MTQVLLDSFQLAVKSELFYCQKISRFKKSLKKQLTQTSNRCTMRSGGEHGKNKPLFFIWNSQKIQSVILVFFGSNPLTLSGRLLICICCQEHGNANNKEKSDGYIH